MIGAEETVFTAMMGIFELHAGQKIRGDARAGLG
jgi:hypothetical protein